MSEVKSPRRVIPKIILAVVSSGLVWCVYGCPRVLGRLGLTLLQQCTIRNSVRIRFYRYRNAFDISKLVGVPTRGSTPMIH